MNMSRITTVLIGCLLFFGSCKNNDEKVTPNGMKYKVIKNGDGTRPKVNEIVVFNIVTTDSKDSLWNSTYNRGLPGIVRITDSVNIASEDGMQQMFRMLSKGDSVEVKIPVTKLFSDFVRGPIPPEVDSTLTIFYRIKIEEVMDEERFQTFQAELFENRRNDQNKKDEELISQYLRENNINAERDSSGIYFVLHTNGGKQKPTTESCVMVNYEGKLLQNGQVFDKNQGISFPLNQVIPGWQIGIPKLGLTDKGTIYIPSSLAYGPQGVPGAIPPNSILVFDVELLSIGAGYDPATQSCK
jgi:FKBP-type peptidyl-prolyl cis-trans isomerase FkpA